MGRRLLWPALGLLVAVVVVFGVAAPPERCPEITPVGLRRAAEEASGWLVRNQEPDGRWLYQYDADTDTVIDDYNVIRHAGVTMSLYQAAGAGLGGALASADRGLAWAEDRIVERDGWVALRSGAELPVGASALLTAALAERRILTGDAGHDRLLRGLGRFLVSQVEPSGAVLASYRLADDRPVAGVYSRYYTGEAYWALARLHRLFPDEGWGEAANRIGGYMAADRDDAEGYWPPLPDHWAAYGQSETVAFPEREDDALTDDEAAYAARQAGLFGGQVRWISQRSGPWGVFVRGTFLPRGGGYGVVGEALTGLWLVAGKEPSLAGHRAAVGERARCIAGLAVAAQSDEEDAAGYADPSRVQGAWLRDGETRMDDQQHALSALLRTIPIVEQEAAAAQAGSGDDAGPPGALWLWVVLAGLNPFRAALGIPRQGRTRREVTVVAGLGGVLGATIVVVAAVLGGLAVDAIDVSEPAVRIGAGAVAAVVGAADLLRRPPSAEPALPGRRAALVPVAIPLVARPVLVILAVAAGAAGSLPVAALAMVLGITVLVASAGLAPVAGPGGRVLAWAARVVAAALLAGAVVLVVGGVLAV